MGNYSFKKDLATSKVTEVEVADLLCDGSITSAKLPPIDKIKGVRFNNDNKYDLEVRYSGDITITFEIKEDFYHAKSNNIAVEYASRGKESGITVTEADWHIYVVHTKKGTKEYILVSTETLRTNIVTGAYDKEVSGGDVGSETKNYLFKYKTFVSMAEAVYKEGK
jgi:hypothetical protein